MKIHLSEVELNSSTIDQNLFGWNLVDSFSSAAYLRFRGIVKKHLDCLNLKWRIEEACELTHCEGILVDLREVDVHIGTLDVGLLRQNIQRKVSRFAVNETVDRSKFTNCDSGEISSNIDDFSSVLVPTALSSQSSQLELATLPELLERAEQIDLPISTIKAQFFQWQMSSNLSAG